MQQRHVVAPAAACERVEGRPREISGHGDPRGRSRRPGSGAGTRRPERRLPSTSRAVARAGSLRQNSRMLGPRNRPTSSHAGEHASRPSQRQARVHVEPPRGVGHGGPRNRELERGDHSARRDDAGEPGERRRRVVDVAEEVRERQPVEARLGERKLLRAPLLELERASRDPLARPASALRRASPGSGRSRRPSSRSGARARSRRLPCRWRRRARRRPARPRSARRGSAASADPARSSAAPRSGRTWGRAERRDRAPAGCARSGRRPRLYSCSDGPRERAQRRRRGGRRVPRGGRGALRRPGRGALAGAARLPVRLQPGRGGVLAGAADDGAPLADRALVRDAVSIVGLCELAEESAGGGDPERARRASLGRERPVSEAREAADAALEQVIAEPPRVASPAYLDAVGAAASRLERALGELGPSPFAAGDAGGTAAVEELASDVERDYKRPARLVAA